MTDNQNVKIYYRVLHSSDHVSDWNAGHYFSYHFSLPGEWIQLFYKESCHDQNKYALQTSLGKFTDQARRRFLQIAPSYKPSEIWSASDRKDASQLDGVCAFEDAESALKYVEGNVYPGIYIVVFEGYFVSNIPETDGTMTGVLAKPIKKLLFQDLEAFRNNVRR
jgi:hypothetical protein